MTNQNTSENLNKVIKNDYVVLVFFITFIEFIPLLKSVTICPCSELSWNQKIDLLLTVIGFYIYLRKTDNDIEKLKKKWSRNIP